MKRRIDKKNIVIALVGTAFVLSFIYFLSPNIVGYVTYPEINQQAELKESLELASEQIETLELDLLLTDNNMSSCTEFKDDLLGQITIVSDNLAKCTSDLGTEQATQKAAVAQIKDEIQDCEADLVEENNDLANLQDDYNRLALNSANNICCKKKFDNPSIDSYEISGNKITCLENGDKSLDCNFS